MVTTTPPTVVPTAPAPVAPGGARSRPRNKVATAARGEADGRHEAGGARAGRCRAAIASVPVPAKKRVKPDVAAKPPSEVASDEDEAIAFSSPPRRVRAHRMSYGPVESEPAKL